MLLTVPMDHSHQWHYRLSGKRRWIIITACLVLAASLLVIFQHARGVRAAPEHQTTPPQYNWYVCEDLGIGSVPGLPGLYQRLRLCHRRGWQVLAYCIEPNIPPPPLNTTCSRITADTYWCGDLFQLLREYALEETPTPAPTDTQTPVPTQTSTSTPLPSATASPSPTASPTETNTPTPATPPGGTVPPNQITVTAPPGTTSTAPPAGTPTTVGFGSTPTPRPVPGGDGVLPPGPAPGLFAALLAVLGITGWVTLRRPRARQGRPHRRR
jgi:hypothetical protein